jgi:hypothetical protein
MMSQAERHEMLGRWLERYAPGEWAFAGVEVRAQGAPAGWAPESRFTLRTRTPPGAVLLEVALRGDGDVDVHFHVPGHEPDWVEAHYVLPDGEEREAIEEVARFVGDFVGERLILAYDTWRGRRFVPVEELASLNRRRLAWRVSWRGTHDWQRP